MILRYTLAWLPLIVIAILNGTLRVKVYGPYMAELTAHQVSTFTGIFFFGLYIWGIEWLWPPESAQQMLIVGAIWLGLTVAFEFLFGHYVMGTAWERLFHDYNIFAGRLWGLLLLWVALGPYLVFRMRGT